MIIIDETRHVKAAVYGGAFLGGCGGGSIEKELRLGELAVKLGGIKILEAHEVDDDDILITSSAVGGPSTKREVKPSLFINSIRVLEECGVKVNCLVTAENGGFNTVNGWVQSAALEIPVADIPCNGRAHPTILMGSMGLHRDPKYTSIQVAVGEDENNRISVLVRGNLTWTSRIIREISVSTDSILAVARNPVKASYAKKHGAPGAISMALKIGEAIYKSLREDPGEAPLERILGKN